VDRVAVSPEGNLTYQFKVAAIEVVPEEGVADVMVETLRTQMRSLEGLTGRATVTARGLVREADLKAPPGGSAQMQQSLENLRQSMRQMSAPLPEEPVGKGARWEAKTIVESPAGKLANTTTYTLKTIDGDRIDLDISMNQVREGEGSALPPAVPGRPRFKSIASTGTGGSRLDLSCLLPRSEMKISTVMEAEAAVPVPGGPPSTGAAAPTVMKMRLVMDMKVFPDEGPKSAAK